MKAGAKRKQKKGGRWFWQKLPSGVFKKPCNARRGSVVTPKCQLVLSVFMIIRKYFDFLWANSLIIQIASTFLSHVAMLLFSKVKFSSVKILRISKEPQDKNCPWHQYVFVDLTNWLPGDSKVILRKISKDIFQQGSLKLSKLISKSQIQRKLIISL